MKKFGKLSKHKYSAWVLFLLQHLAIVGIITGFLVLMTGFIVIRFLVYPNVRVQEMAEKSSALTDYDFSYSITHETDNGPTGWTIDGTWLPGVRQAQIYLTSIENGTKSPGVELIIDGDNLYINTRDLFRVTGHYWLGDMNSEQYFTEMYDSIFSSEITLIDMPTYGCEVWSGTTQWINILKTDSAILKDETQCLINPLHYSGGGATFSATLGTKDLVSGLNQILRNIQLNEDMYQKDLASMIRSYGVEVGLHSGVFGQTMSAWTSEQAEALESANPEEIELFTDVYEFLGNLITTCQKTEATMTHTIRESNEETINVFTIECGEDETYTLYTEVRPSFHTSIEVPDEFESFATQLALLEESYETILDTDTELLEKIEQASEETDTNSEETEVSDESEDIESAELSETAETDSADSSSPTE